MKSTAMNTNTRKLSAKYTMEITQDIEHMSEINAELEKILAKEIQNEMLNGIARLTLLDSGYTYVQYIPNVPDEWIKDHVQYEYKNYGSHWYFKEKSDAAMFMLKWL